MLGHGHPEIPEQHRIFILLNEELVATNLEGGMKDLFEIVHLGAGLAGRAVLAAELKVTPYAL